MSKERPRPPKQPAWKLAAAILASLILAALLAMLPNKVNDAASLQLSLRPTAPPCAPDPFLAEDTLRVLFNDFNAGLSGDVPRASIFSYLVNDVRQRYVLPILQLQQEIISQSTRHEQGSSDLMAQHQQHLALQHDQLTAQCQERLTDLTENFNRQIAQREEQLSSLTESHNRQIADINRELEQERAKRAKCSECTAFRGWIIAIDVVYSDEGGHAPHDRITEFGGRADDINSGFGGKFVWLVPRYDVDSARAITGIDIAIQWHGDPARSDLAKGAGDQFRFLIPRFDQDANKIHDIHLLRMDGGIGRVPPGYNGHSSDINEGRRGDFLYLIWKSHSV